MHHLLLSLSPQTASIYLKDDSGAQSDLSSSPTLTGNMWVFLRLFSKNLKGRSFILNFLKVKLICFS
jgi:hypothetical protein